MICVGIELIVTIECSDGNITIKTKEGAKTHFIFANCNNIVAITAKQDCVMIREDDTTAFCRHIITVNYVLSDRPPFTITINKDGFMGVTSGLDVLLELYGLKRELTHSFCVSGNQCLKIENSDRHAIMSQRRDEVMAAINTRSDSFKMPTVCKSIKGKLSGKVNPGDVYVMNGGKKVMFNVMGITSTIDFGNTMKCRAKANISGKIIEFELVKGRHPYEGPVLETKYYSNDGPLSDFNPRVIGQFAIITANYIIARSTVSRAVDGSVWD
jgi:hypothetical protein